MSLIWNKTNQKYENELIVVCSEKGAKSYKSIEDLKKDWSDGPSEASKGFDWEKAKENLIKTECGITLCREDYFEGDKKHFTFDEGLKIEKEAKKHGFRLPTVVDFEKLYAFYGVDEEGDDTPQRFINELGFSYAGDYNGTSLGGVGSYGLYWSSSVHGASNGYGLGFNSSSVYPQGARNKYNGFAVKFIYDPEGEGKWN